MPSKNEKNAVSYEIGGSLKIVFYCVKRRFGEYFYSIKRKKMIQKMMLKTSLYNKMISILYKIK